MLLLRQNHRHPGVESHTRFRSDSGGGANLDSAVFISSHIRIVTQLNGQHYEARITTQSPPIYSVLVNALGCSLGGKGCCGLQQEYELQSRVQPGVDERPLLLAKEQVRRSAVRARGQYRAGR